MLTRGTPPAGQESRRGSHSLTADVGAYDIPEFSKVLRATGQVRIQMIASMGTSSIHRFIPPPPKGRSGEAAPKFFKAISHS